MSGRLEGKVALITAAGQGIGRATALQFSDEGAIVWATDINEGSLEALVGEDSSIKVRTLDVRDGRSVAAMAEETGPINILFNCAGYVHQGTIFECSEDDWKLSFDVNVSSIYQMCRAFIPGMIAMHEGSIINMSSVVSSVKGAPNRVAYGTTKAAVIGLTKALAVDYISMGIRCNALCPGTIDTPSLAQRIAALTNDNLDIATVRTSFVARQPMGRLGHPEEVAKAALYLASDDSSFMTGQALIVDGGWSI